MCLGMVIAAFIGGFLASYYVTDQIMERAIRKHFYMPPPRFEHKMFNDFDKEIQKNFKSFDNMFNNKNGMEAFKYNHMEMIPTFMPEKIKIETEIEDGNYNIEVGLKTFQIDENKINYNVVGRKLTVFGESMIKNDKSKQDISFSYDFLLPDGADINNIRKYRDGKKVVISVPIKN